ncbi:MAG: AAA family ATPase [bacterium]|nr:AAA family ATPase [bacterium]
MKKHIITINGFPGSGKSSTAKGVARKLQYEHFSSGDFFREMAKARGLTVEEINFAAEKQKEIDFEVDNVLKKIGKEKNDMVIDSRLAFHWIPDSFKVFLDLEPKVAANRTFAQIQKEGRTSQSGQSIEEVLINTFKRRESEQKRYQDLYDVDINNKTRFDLVVDTGINDLKEVINIVTVEYQKWL